MIFLRIIEFHALTLTIVEFCIPAVTLGWVKNVVQKWGLCRVEYFAAKYRNVLVELCCLQLGFSKHSELKKWNPISSVWNIKVTELKKHLQCNREYETGLLHGQTELSMEISCSWLCMRTLSLSSVILN